MSAGNTTKFIIMIIEDDLNSQLLMKFYLKDTYELCFSTSVTESLDHLSSHDVDLILLDLSQEGGEDGLDLVRWLRKEEKWKTIPVISTTAHAFTTDRDNCLNAGCNDYIAKPISREVLLERIAHYLSD